MNWVNTVINDSTRLSDALLSYKAEYNLAVRECNIIGNIETAAAQMPGIVEYRFSQLQELEAILEYLNIELQRIKTKCFRSYLENYPRALSSRDCEKFADGEPDVLDWRLKINQCALIRNKFLGVTKALEQKHYQLSNIVKLRCAGLEDATL